MLKKTDFLSKYSTFKIGGLATIYEPENLQELINLVENLNEAQENFIIIGAASNILFPENINFSVITTKKLNKVEVFDNYINVEAGAFLGFLTNFAALSGLAGLEPFAKIPGTIGGSIVAGAGAFGKNLADLVKDVTIYKNGSIKLVYPKKNQYRKNPIPEENFILLKATFKLEKDEPQGILDRIKKYNKLRSNQPKFPSAGCFFKNPTGFSAGKLIDEAGLKGFKIGGALVSFEHANFIVNFDNATYEDVLKVAKYVKSAVEDKFNISLEEEVIILNENGERIFL